MQSIITTISDYLGYSEDKTIEISDKAPGCYKRYLISKKNGKGQRAIYHPAKDTKILQYAFMETILPKLKVHQSATAYEKDTNILKNAVLHSNYAYTIRIDLKDFFPSIVPRDLIKIMQASDAFGELSKKDLKFIKNSLFVKLAKRVKGLGIGAPSSPKVCNIVMYDIDCKICEKIPKNTCYTRYADDLVFSSNVKNECREFLNLVTEILEKTASPKLEINQNKTLFMSKGTRRVVTGLHITPQGKISLGRKNKRYIRKLLFDFKNGKTKNITYLRGYLSFISDVEPDWYDRLTLKYSAEVMEKVKNYN